MEFYDYQQDPDALHNLIADPKMKRHIYALTAELLQHMQTTKDPQLAAFKKTVGIE
jgi:N-sulfoglucosamine sulfohydrolase